ncbi:MAG: MFS transporter [Actinomycetaceae bacterium]
MHTHQTLEATRSDRLPWGALATMTFAVFVVVSAEMLPTAVLPQMAAGLDVPLGGAGLLVSAWALTVVVASFPLTALTARFDRPTVIAGALAVVAVSTMVTAAADSYGVAMGSRLVAAGATGLLWSTINAHAASIVPEHRIARATAIVLAGGTLGTIAAIPAGNAVGAALGWRVPFVALAVLAAVAALAVVSVLRAAPAVAAVDTTDAGERPSGSRRPLWPVLAAGGLGGLVLVAHFGPFTFVTELLAPSSVPAPVLLVLFGLAGIGGVAVVGVASDRHPGATPTAMALAMVVALAALQMIGLGSAVDVAIVLGWGLVVGAVGPAVQSTLMRLAGDAHRRTAGTIMPVAMNLGIAVGAAAGSASVDRWSVGALPVLAVVPAVLAAVGLAVLARALRARRPGAGGQDRPPRVYVDVETNRRDGARESASRGG